MKRLIALILLVVMATSTLALADDYDYSSYSYDELVKIQAAIQAEIDSRLTATALLIPGTYTCGVDIAAGSYLLIGIMEKGPGGNSPEVLIYGNAKDFQNSNSLDYQYLETGEKWRITLTDGMILIVSCGDIEIQKAPALVFAP